MNTFTQPLIHIIWRAIKMTGRGKGGKAKGKTRPAHAEPYPSSHYPPSSAQICLLSTYSGLIDYEYYPLTYLNTDVPFRTSQRVLLHVNYHLQTALSSRSSSVTRFNT